MSPFAVFVLCIQVCLIQTVMSQQCGCDCGSSGYVGSPIVVGYSSNSNGANCGGYGGEGIGEVNVAGKVNACGETCLKGAVPVIGAVNFEGCIPACGKFSVCGECGCGCGCY